MLVMVIVSQSDISQGGRQLSGVGAFNVEAKKHGSKYALGKQRLTGMGQQGRTGVNQCRQHFLTLFRGGGTAAASEILLGPKFR